MPWRALADAVVVLHLAVIAFIVFGGVLALRWPRVMLVHVPFAAWGVAIELWQWVCPLTPLENLLRERGGGTAYRGGFIEHYVLPVLYPTGLDLAMGLVLAAVVLAVNLAVYAVVFGRLRRTAPR